MSGPSAGVWEAQEGGGGEELWIYSCYCNEGDHNTTVSWDVHITRVSHFSDSSSGFNTCFVKHSKWNMIFHLCLRSVIDRFKSISKSVGQLEYHSKIVFLPPGISCFLFFTCVQHMCGFSSTRVFVCVFEAPACAMLMTHLHYKRVELFLCLGACGLLQLQPNQADVRNKRERNLHELLNF